MTEKNDLEDYGDNHTQEEIADDMANMSDLALGKIAGVASILKDHECGGAMETSGATDGSCKVYNAALDEFDQRSKSR